MPSISFSTDQSGANSQICSTTSSIFNFSVADNYTVSSAEFVLKSGSSSTGSVTVGIYAGRNATGSLIASVSIPVASIPQSYTPTTFTFPANTQLTANSDYSLKVSSATSCSGSGAFFIKAGNFQVLSAGTLTVLSVGYALAARTVAQTTLTAAPKATMGARASLSVQSTVSAQATAIRGLLAAFAAEPAAQARLALTLAAVAGISTRTQLAASMSRLGANEINKLQHGTSLIVGLRLGDNPVAKAYLGSTLVLEQPT